MTISAIKPIPVDLVKQLNDIPLNISDRIFNEMKSQETRGGYKKVQVLPTDPEWRFVWRYFHHDKPHRYGIKRIYCVYERHQQKTFEFNLSSIEREANKFKPTWSQEPRAQQRAQAIERWKQMVSVFSPFFTMETDGRKRYWKNTKIIPLWHGSSKEICESIATSGFVYFGKISLGGYNPKSTDEGFFGSGIYFTNSARYASDIYSRGYIFLAWVSMREPFPLVGDPSQTDMKNIKGRGAYKDYNTHYVPVTSIDPSEPYEAIYYPTKENETPHCDEVVVFQKSQTLPRFWVELEIELPYVPSDIPQFVNELIFHIMKLLQNPNIDRDERLRNYLCKELGILLTLEGDDYLEEKHKSMYEKLSQILDPQGKVNKQVSYALTGTQDANVASPSPQPMQSVTSHSSNNLVSPQPFPPKHSISLNSNPTVQTKFFPSISYVYEKFMQILGPQEKVNSQAEFDPYIPDIAFGKTDWEEYFGDIGVEPPLPVNIEEILNEPCSFWPNKKVKETHLLVLIPNTVNGKPFTMDYLGELIQKPKSGHSTKYRVYSDYAKEALGDQSYLSHWVLMTRDIIPGSRNEKYSKCCDLIANHSNKTGLPYELPHLLEVTASILMHYVKTVGRLYSDKPLTYTYSQDVDKYNHSLCVGDFRPGGLYVCDYHFIRFYISALGVAGCRRF